jgi:hypothetical protein
MQFDQLKRREFTAGMWPLVARADNVGLVGK